MDADTPRPAGQPYRRPLGVPKPHAPRPRRPDRPARGASSAPPGPGGPTLPAWRCRPRDPRRPAPRWTGVTRRQRDRAMERDDLRRFLRAYPRTEAGAVFATRAADGRPVAATRAQLAALIDTRLHPRQRQVVRLGIEERWARERVCAHLKGISRKTYERDQTSALETLLAAIRAEGDSEGAGRHA